LNESVSPRRFALAIVDEQHRFGVRQRLALRRLDPAKNEWKSGGDGGMVPHLLVMSATPIPRSMALALHGDLDLLTLPDKPAGRQPIHTRVCRTVDEQAQALDRLRAVAMEGGQGFVVCPAIEAEEGKGRASLKQIARTLRERLAPATMAMVHGQLPKDEAERIVAAFARGEIHVLLATTVLEVGVDVPAARIMVVMDAERFGLAQLHQLRGRVGRGPNASECHLCTQVSDPATLARLAFLATNHDGFMLAEEDLRQRGAGDLIGERQSGESPFTGAGWAEISQLVGDARQEAMTMLERDPRLFDPNHPVGCELDQFVATMASAEDAG
jgi:ATP-dependent DNA helicase RecG